MKRILVLLSVACLLVSTGHETLSAKEVNDSTAVNFVQGNTWQFFDNRNNDSNVSGIPWVNISKGDYLLLDVMIQTGGKLQSFDDIIEVTVQPMASDYAYLSFTMMKSSCNSYLGNPWKEFYLYLRFSPWMQTSTWNYTMRYYGKNGKVHIQQFQRPGADAVYGMMPPLTPTFDNNKVSWQGIGSPNWDITYKMRILDDNGCFIDEVNYGEPDYLYDYTTGEMSFNLVPYRGKVVRVENRKNVPGYGLGGYGTIPPTLGLTARSVYLFKVPE